MKKISAVYFIASILFFKGLYSFGQKVEISVKIDSLIQKQSTTSFNGVILISQNGKTVYSKTIGFSNLEKKTLLQFDDPFIIASISKQITAVLILREVESGHINLYASIDDYLPELKKRWPSDTITVLQLLTHTHGIISLTQPLRFKPGTQFLYSQIGYDLLAKIVEKTSGKSFAQAANELFKICNMTHSAHPDHQPANLVVGYTEQEDGSFKTEGKNLENYPAAGGFISTAADLERWNRNLQNGKLLNGKNFQLMITKQNNAVRNHPIFGQIFYGLGITVGDEGGILQLGQTGFVPGFVTMNFYYPKTKTSIIVLENIAYHTTDLKQTFSSHTALLKIIRETILSDK